MNFACRTSAPVCSRKMVKTSKVMSHEAKSRRDYIRNHNFSIEADLSGRCEVKVTKKGE